MPVDFPRLVQAPPGIILQESVLAGSPPCEAYLGIPGTPICGLPSVTRIEGQCTCKTHRLFLCKRCFQYFLRGMVSCSDCGNVIMFVREI